MLEPAHIDAGAAEPLLTRALAIYGKGGASMNAYPRSMYAKALFLSGRTDAAASEARALRSLGFGRSDFVRLCRTLRID